MRKILLLTVFVLSFITSSAQSTFTSNLAARAKGNANIYGVVECDGKPVEGVAVSDGYTIVLTDRKGQYCFRSAKRNGNVFITIPSGYEAVRDGNDVVPQFWAELCCDIDSTERHDFALKAVDNDRHVIVAVADIHIANHHNDMSNFRDIFIPKLNKELEKYHNAGIPAYTFCLGDSTHDLYWYDYLYDIGDFRSTLEEIRYPTPLFNTLGNHDHDGATPCDENTDFNAAAKYRKAFGPTYYSVNIGKIHYIMLDNMKYVNTPGGKIAKGIVGTRNCKTELSAEQLEWLKKDLELVTDKNTPIVIGVHSPIYRYRNGMDGEINNALSEPGGSLLTDLLQPFPNVHVISGHAHRNRTTYGRDDSSKPEIANIIEHNIVAVSGSLWYSSGFGEPMLGSLGEPAGCKIFTIDNTRIEWYFSPTQLPSSEQFRCFDMNTVREYFKNNGEVRVFIDHFPGRTDYAGWDTDNSVMINVWDWANDWKIKVTENGKELDVKRCKAENPQMLIGLDIPNSLWNQDFDSKKNKRKLHPHMFHVIASGPDTTIEVTVTDCFGNEYKQTMVRPKLFHLHMK